MTWKSRVCALALLLDAAGCASNYYGSYKQSHPDWFVVFPTTDIGLEETLASIYAPPTGAYQLVISKLQVYRTSTSPWQMLTEDELKSPGFVPNDRDDYAVAVLVWCSSEVDLERFTGERASWYLLPKNRLAYLDHYDFSERCVISNDYRPAPVARAEVERKLVGDVASNMTRTPVHAAQLYLKGVQLVAVGRVDEARAMLQAGDQTFDPNEAGGGPHFDAGRSVAVGDAEDTSSARKALVDALQRYGDALPGTTPAGAGAQ